MYILVYGRGRTDRQQYQQYIHTHTYTYTHPTYTRTQYSLGACVVALVLLQGQEVPGDVHTVRGREQRVGLADAAIYDQLGVREPGLAASRPTPGRGSRIDRVISTDSITSSGSTDTDRLGHFTTAASSAAAASPGGSGLGDGGGVLQENTLFMNN